MRTLLQRFTPHRMHGTHSMFAEAIFRGCTCPRSALPLARARSAPTEQEAQLRRTSHRCQIFTDSMGAWK